jgi:hypothetical protein
VTESNEAVRVRMARWRAGKREAAGLPPRHPRIAGKERPFWGIDGEGCGHDRHGRQHYMLLCAGNDADMRELYTGKPLTMLERFDWICNLPAKPILVGFAFGYDCTQLLRELDQNRRKDLFVDKRLDRDGNPTDIHALRVRKSDYTYINDQFGVVYLPGKYLRICRLERRPGRMTHLGRRPSTLHPIKGSVRTIWETFGFFQKKFSIALADFDIGTPAERKLIQRNKAERAQFQRMTREVRDYCKLECALEARMMETLRTACTACGIKPADWSGAGRLAEAMHRDHGTMTKERLHAWVPSGVLGFAQAAYYGGRFECVRVGRVKRPVYEHDINSAYPAAMLKLPCLEHGTWKYCSAEEIADLYRTDKNALFVAQTAFDHSRHSNGPMCGLPFRKKGSLSWPIKGQGVYWSVELRSAARLGARYQFGSGWRYVTPCQCIPFDWIKPLYEARIRMGKSTAGKPIKLGMNSLYGKLAQRVGNPRYGNFIWAGLITAHTRAALNEAIATAPADIVMIATDGIYSLSPLPLPVGPGLGQWETKQHQAGLFLLQPGLYWGPNLKAVLKTRGVSPGFFAHHAVRAKIERAWGKYVQAGDQHANPPKVAVKLRLFGGLRLATARGDVALAGKWLDSRLPPSHPNYLAPKVFSFDWRRKRSRGEWEGEALRTYALPGGGDDLSDWISDAHGADETLFDQLDMDQAEFDEQPEFFQMAAALA